MDKNQTQKDIYVALYLHWYRKEHYGRILGVFTTQQKAINCIEKTKPKPQYQHVNISKTFHAVYQYSSPEMFEQLEFGMYVVQPVFAPKQNKIASISITVQFPVWVSSFKGEGYNINYVSKLQNEIRKAVKVEIMDTPQKPEVPETFKFSTKNSKEKHLHVLFNCMIL